MDEQLNDGSLQYVNNANDRENNSHTLNTNEDYCRKVIPFIKSLYYANRQERVVFEEIEKFLDKYNTLPTKETLTIGVDNRKDINDEDYKKVVDIISSLDKTEVDLQWLHDETEKFCKDKAIYITQFLME